MDLPIRAGDTNGSLIFASPWRGETQTSASYFTAMNKEFQGQVERDPRLAAHAASTLPAWLWSADGTRIVWANLAGANVFGAADRAELAARNPGPADPHRRQVARLSHQLPANGAVRMERLRGFGAAPGMLMTCGCSRLDFPDGHHGVLVVATATARSMKPRASSAKAAPASPPEAAPQPAAMPIVSEPPSLPDPAPPAPTGEAPAEFALFDAFAEDDREQAAPPAASAEPDEPDLQNVLQLDLPPVEASPCGEAVPAIESAELPESNVRRHPLRFVWQTDAEGRFTLGSDEFTRLIGPRTADGFGRPWHDIAQDFALDPQGRVEQALASRETWIGIELDWPTDKGHVPVELSGLPVFDRDRNFGGYRGFGLCRDFDRLVTLRQHEFSTEPSAPQPLSADIVQAGPAGDSPEPDLPAELDIEASASPDLPEALRPKNSPQTDLDIAVETPNEPSAEILAELPKNVLPFRPIGEAKAPVLTPVENSAFNELARQLSERLETDNGRLVAVVTQTQMVL